MAWIVVNLDLIVQKRFGNGNSEYIKASEWALPKTGFFVIWDNDNTKVNQKATYGG